MPDWLILVLACFLLWVLAGLYLAVFTNQPEKSAWEFIKDVFTLPLFYLLTVFCFWRENKKIHIKQ